MYIDAKPGDKKSLEKKKRPENDWGAAFYEKISRSLQRTISWSREEAFFRRQFPWFPLSL
jgi:hypothetical protein